MSNRAALRRWNKREIRLRALEGSIKLEPTAPGESACYVYCIGPKDGDRIKVGMGKCVAARLKTTQTYFPDELVIHWQKWFPSREMAQKHEEALHKALSGFGCYAKEWFKVTVAEFLELRNLKNL
jgi:hypothetical protein